MTTRRPIASSGNRWMAPWRSARGALHGRSIETYPQTRRTWRGAVQVCVAKLSPSIAMEIESHSRSWCSGLGIEVNVVSILRDECFCSARGGVSAAALKNSQREAEAGTCQKQAAPLRGKVKPARAPHATKNFQLRLAAAAKSGDTKSKDRCSSLHSQR